MVSTGTMPATYIDESLFRPSAGLDAAALRTIPRVRREHESTSNTWVEQNV